jgi:hypothetical protein
VGVQARGVRKKRPWHPAEEAKGSIVPRAESSVVSAG